MLLTIILAVALIGVDQLLKFLAVQYLMPVGEVPVIPGVVGLKYVENTGAAFNILTGRQPFLIIITGIALLVVAYVLLFRRPKGKLEYIAILFIFSGGVGNLIDRIARGYVVDYVNTLFMNFAVFNFADSLVVVGFVLFVIALIRGEIKSKAQRAAAAAGPAGEENAGGGHAAPQAGAPNGDAAPTADAQAAETEPKAEPGPTEAGEGDGDH